MSHRCQPRRPVVPFQPRVEDLEDRLPPAVSVLQMPGSNLVLVAASGPNQVVRIVDQGGNGAGALRVPAAKFTSTAVPVGEPVVIDVFTGHNSDRVRYVSAGYRPRGAGAHAPLGHRLLQVFAGDLTAPFHRDATRTATTRSGERVEAVVNSNATATALALTLQGLTANPTTFQLNAGPFTTPTLGTFAPATTPVPAGGCTGPVVLFSPPFPPPSLAAATPGTLIPATVTPNQQFTAGLTPGTPAVVNGNLPLTGIGCLPAAIPATSALGTFFTAAGLAVPTVPGGGFIANPLVLTALTAPAFSNTFAGVATQPGLVGTPSLGGNLTSMGLINTAVLGGAFFANPLSGSAITASSFSNPFLGLPV
jgi:hypothetical protein